jgi:hypothetical protein
MVYILAALSTALSLTITQVYNWEPHKDVCYKLYIEDRKVRRVTQQTTLSPEDCRR